MPPLPQQPWSLTTSPLANGDATEWAVLQGKQPATVIGVLEAWANDEGYRQLWIEALATAPFTAYRWETPPLTLSTLHNPFECVLIDRPNLTRPRPDRKTFTPYFQSRSPFPGVVCFPNLGGDAQLVVPTPEVADMAYPHLAVFSRQAPMWQQHALWQAVADAVLQAIKRHNDDSPLWINTAGGGVAWLHIRLDSSPKYYQHRPYRRLC